MINPFRLADDDKDKAIIYGYCIDVKDYGDVCMLLFKKDTMDPSSDLISVAAWGVPPGMSGTDMRKMGLDCKGKFVVCVVGIRKKEKDGKLYENFDLKFIIKAPEKNHAA